MPEKELKLLQEIQDALVKIEMIFVDISISVELLHRVYAEDEMKQMKFNFKGGEDES